MFTYQILIEYDGTEFVGWQFQKNGTSIQEIIQKALKKLTKKNIIIFGAGRTDAGVHAFEQSAHFKIENKIIKPQDNERFFGGFILNDLTWKENIRNNKTTLTTNKV